MNSKQNYANDSIRILVQPKLKQKVKRRAAQLGVNMSVYLKYLILTDLQKMPEYEASDSVIADVEKALEEKKMPSTQGGKASDILDNII